MSFQFKNMQTFIRNCIQPEIIAVKALFLTMSVPKRGVLLWNGTFGGSDGKRPVINNAPMEAFALCDGTNGTPNMLPLSDDVNLKCGLTDADRLYYIMRL